MPLSVSVTTTASIRPSLLESISALRKKLNACGAPEDAIRTLRGFGYAISCPIELR